MDREDICMPVVLSKPVDQLIKNYDTPGRRVVTADRVYVRPWGPLTKSNSRSLLRVCVRDAMHFPPPPPFPPKRESRISISRAREFLANISQGDKGVEWEGGRERKTSIIVNNSTLLRVPGFSLPFDPGNTPPPLRLDDLKNFHEEVHRGRSLEGRGNIHPFSSLLLYFAPLLFKDL